MKKKWKKMKKKNSCVLIFIIECVYWCSRVTWLSMFVEGSSYVSFPRPFIFCFHFCRMFWERDEWLSLRSFGSLSLPSLCSLLVWLHFMSDLSWSLLLFVLFVSSSSSFSLLIHHFHFTSYSFLTATHLGFDILFASSLHISLSIWFSSLPHYCYHIHIGHPQVHGSWDFLYMFHFIHEGMGFDHWVFEPSFPSYLHLITLTYVSSHVLRPPWGHGIRCHLR